MIRKIFDYSKFIMYILLKYIIMEALDLLRVLIKEVENHYSEIGITSPIMYDPDKLQYKVSFSIMERVDGGVRHSFMVTVDDLKK